MTELTEKNLKAEGAWIHRYASNKPDCIAQSSLEFALLGHPDYAFPEGLRLK